MSKNPIETKLRSYKKEEIKKLRGLLLDKSENSEWVKLMNSNYSSLHNSINKMQNSDLLKSYLELVKETYYENRMLELINNLNSEIDNGLEKIDNLYLEVTNSIEFLLEFEICAEET